MTAKNKKINTDTQQAIRNECNAIRDMLIEKNKAYGDSALNPIRIFASSDSVEQLKVRIDDKLNRIKKGNEYQGEDTILDLIGYLVLLLIAHKGEK